jgi:hypothetical protein
MTEVEKNQIALEYFKGNFDAGAIHESYGTTVLYGETKLADALWQLENDDDVKLAVELGIVDKDWVGDLKKNMKDMDKNRREGKKNA